MAKIKLGDIFEVNTPKGKGYLHYFHRDNDGIDYIRVLQGLYYERPPDFSKIASNPERYVIGFPLSAAYRRKLVDLAGFYPADDYKMPKFMRDPYLIRGEFLGWHIVNTETLHRAFVKELSPEQKKLSPWGIVNDTLLIERLVNNWNLDDWEKEVKQQLENYIKEKGPLKKWNIDDYNHLDEKTKQLLEEYMNK
jgi:hypothetical protein